MYNTLDVHFYAGAALRSLWPQIEASIQRDICSAVPLQNLEQRRMLGSGLMAPRKVAGAVRRASVARMRQTRISSPAQGGL